jgi:hypothetical protein
MAAAGMYPRFPLVILDYASVCCNYCFPGAAHRNMWAEFEWENKVAVNTSFTNCYDFLQHIVATTNMKCLTPISAADGAPWVRWEFGVCVCFVGGDRGRARSLSLLLMLVMLNTV